VGTFSVATGVVYWSIGRFPDGIVGLGSIAVLPIAAGVASNVIAYGGLLRDAEPANDTCVVTVDRLSGAGQRRDGMPDWWEIRWFGSLVRDGTADDDRDGLSDRLEWELGSDPTSRAMPELVGVPRYPPRSPVITNDYSAVNAGQLKWIATRARDAMEATLDSVPQQERTPARWSMGSALRATASRESRSGQARCEPFYDRLIEAGRADGNPWTGALRTNDFGPANIGQVKHVFSFDWK